MAKRGRLVDLGDGTVYFQRYGMETGTDRELSDQEKAINILLDRVKDLEDEIDFHHEQNAGPDY